MQIVHIFPLDPLYSLYQISNHNKETKQMTTKTQAQAKREAYQAISMMSKAKAFAIYTKLNCKGKIKAGDTFKAWMDRIITRTVNDWAAPSHSVGA